jgi:hypothetical protein
MKLVKESLTGKINEDDYQNPDDESSVATNQLKNIMKNAQAMLDILTTGQQLDAEVQSKLAVSDDKIQEIKNYLENQATEMPGAEAEVIEPIAMGGDERGPDYGMDYGMEAPVGDGLPPEGPGMEGPDMESPNDDLAGLLPDAFPEEEVQDDAEFNVDIDGDGVGDVNILDVETRYEGEEDKD